MEPSTRKPKPRSGRSKWIALLLIAAGAGPAWIATRDLRERIRSEPAFSAEADRRPTSRAEAGPDPTIQAEAGPDPTIRGVAALGRIEPRHGTVRVAGPPQGGAVIDALLVDEGEVVETGQLLAALRGSDLHQADVARFEAEVAHAERELKRSQGLQRGGAAARAELEAAALQLDVTRAALARARAELELLRVRAPIDGQVLAVHAREGERVGEKGILELGDTSAMYVVAEVYEGDIARVRPGQRAHLRSDALPADLGGEVERIGLMIGKKDVLETDPVSDADARVVEVDIRLDDPAPAAGLTNLRVDVILEP